MKHINIALFVPDEGCPHRCSFCNQKTISGKVQPLRVEEIDEAISAAFKSEKSLCDAELAFFGGSFTGIEKGYMIALLSRAKTYIDSGVVSGIRISTRPDYISGEILTVLKNYGVTAIELGCQSMDDEVLRLNTRGHTADDVRKAAELIKAYGFELGVQMMTGLYGDDDAKAIDTAKKLIALRPDTARIYPTVVLENTRLCEMYREGKYVPQSTEQAVNLCAKLLLMFHDADIPVIRVGLHSGGKVEEGYVTGPYHPAFREICESRIYLDAVISRLEEIGKTSGEIEIRVGKRYVSMLTGQKKCNIAKLNSMGYKCRIVQTDDDEKYKVTVRG